MVIKIINDLINPDRIIFILLVFGAYSQIIDNSSLLFSITKRTKTIRKAIKKI
jgi:hypothetical protein